MFGTVNTVGQSLILVTRDYVDKITVKSICGASATSITGNVNLKAGNVTLNFSGNNSAIIIWWNSKALTASLPTIFVGANVDFGNAIGKSGLLNTSARACIYVCNGATNNPLGNNYIMLIHANSYWNKHPEYFVFNSGKTGTLNCEDLTSLKIDGASWKWAFTETIPNIHSLFHEPK